VKLSFSDSVILDLQNIKAFYAEEGVPAVGGDFVVSIFEHIETLVDHPDIGRVVPEFGEQHIRELIDPPYRIVYLREVKSIQIIRIWRNERLLHLPEDN